MKFRLTIRNRFRWLASWLLHWLGHLVSMPMRRWGHLYPLYSRLMLWSLSIQGDAEQGPWGLDLSGTDQGANNPICHGRKARPRCLELPLRSSDPRRSGEEPRE